MTTEALAPLGDELSAAPPDSFAGLDPAQLARLTSALREEHARRADGLEEAAEEALKLVPALARGPVRRILFKGR
ncbi:hypothetical protein [Streptomyces gobiensis]|uniref:hypothetical protein n=1 Tax=Streptomyces gobiensis TaxID=2875706 RepID=UPI001E44C251|nr:hypothetical protein [Streptomyces gobiensis]UGY90819.1 hypothetical protein test1122_03165 [Streptomyces gobiensis]